MYPLKITPPQIRLPSSANEENNTGDCIVYMPFDFKPSVYEVNVPVVKETPSFFSRCVNTVKEYIPSCCFPSADTLEWVTLIGGSVVGSIGGSLFFGLYLHWYLVATACLFGGAFLGFLCHALCAPSSR